MATVKSGRAIAIEKLLATSQLPAETYADGLRRAAEECRRDEAYAANRLDAAGLEFHERAGWQAIRNSMRNMAARLEAMATDPETQDDGD